MDPDATFRTIVDNLRDLRETSALSARTAAIDALQNLAAWLELGGGPPNVDSFYYDEDEDDIIW